MDTYTSEDCIRLSNLIIRWEYQKYEVRTSRLINAYCCTARRDGEGPMLRLFERKNLYIKNGKRVYALRPSDLEVPELDLDYTKHSNFEWMTVEVRATEGGDTPVRIADTFYIPWEDVLTAEEDFANEVNFQPTDDDAGIARLKADPVEDFSGSVDLIREQLNLSKEDFLDLLCNIQILEGPFNWISRHWHRGRIQKLAVRFSTREQKLIDRHEARIAEVEAELSSLHGWQKEAEQTKAALEAAQNDLKAMRDERDRLAMELENVRQKAAERAETEYPDIDRFLDFFPWVQVMLNIFDSDNPNRAEVAVELKRLYGKEDCPNHLTDAQIGFLTQEDAKPVPRKKQQNRVQGYRNRSK